ncbi:response regulator transcription factor [Clostridioides sp. ES-S-0108-01]|nr:response regulator transcription factor [Clostridioides sp. ES-S-0108-01]UDN52943.1 response regulator transcription factor [Clostridioides sp. ES-S-0107-01]
MKLLVVEDERKLVKNLAKGLRKLGYAVDCAFDGEEALELYELNTYDLMILDLNLPEKDGLEVLRCVRSKDLYFRVIILSARSSVEERVRGLDMGANDYLAKPFDFKELEARIRGLLLREFRQRESRLICGNLEVDTITRTVGFMGIPVSVTKKEYGILEYLMLHKRTISAEDLMEHVWDSEVDLFSNTLKFHMSSLRKKLEEATGGQIEIVTVRGQGYYISSREGTDE